jgi:hypothetical protein
MKNLVELAAELRRECAICRSHALRKALDLPSPLVQSVKWNGRNGVIWVLLVAAKSLGLCVRKPERRSLRTFVASEIAPERKNCRKPRLESNLEP